MGNEFRKFCAPGGVFEQVNASFEDGQVYKIRAQEYNNESDDFCTFLVGALEIPDTVHDVAVEAAGDESEKV